MESAVEIISENSDIRIKLNVEVAILFYTNSNVYGNILNCMMMVKMFYFTSFEHKTFYKKINLTFHHLNHCFLKKGWVRIINDYILCSIISIIDIKLYILFLHWSEQKQQMGLIKVQIHFLTVGGANGKANSLVLKGF